MSSTYSRSIVSDASAAPGVMEFSSGVTSTGADAPTVPCDHIAAARGSFEPLGRPQADRWRSMKDLLGQLRGGDRRSVRVFRQSSIGSWWDRRFFHVVFDGMADADPLVRMRCADAVQDRSSFMISARKVVFNHRVLMSRGPRESAGAGVPLMPARGRIRTPAAARRA